MALWQSLLALALIAVSIGLQTVPAPSTEIAFLDVGQGDAILLQDGTAQVLIDGGQGTAVLQRLGEELPPLDRTIEVVIATHPDRDHLEGLLHVLERYEVGLVLLPRVPHDTQLQDAWLTMLQEQLDQQQIAYRFGWEGQRLKLSDALQLQIVAPLVANGEIVAPGGKTNNAAIIARADFGELSVLLTSDAEASVERLLLQHDQASLDVDILKVGHHGSKSSTTPALVTAVSPAQAVISVGADNRYGHPHSDILDRLRDVPLWRTDEHGSVRFVYTEGGWLLNTAK